MEIVVKAETELSTIERRQIEAVCDQAFKGNNTPYVWTPHSDWHVMVMRDRECVCQVGIVDRIAKVAGQSVRLGGIGGVATPLQWQRRGLASAAMARAAEFMRDHLKVDFGLLVCNRERIPFYSRLGWQEVAGPLTFDQPQGKATYNEVTMILSCTAKSWPPGVIDLCGLPW